MTPNKQQLLKDFVTQQLQSAKQQTQPIVNPNGFKNGEPPAGSNWRIPGDTLYNPTPYPIQAVSDNGIAKTLNPFDESSVQFPGAQYVDEYKMRFGGLPKYQGDTGPSEVIEDTTPRPTLEIQGEKPGLWRRFLQSYANPLHWGVDDLSDNYPKGDPRSSYMNVLLDQRSKGNSAFMWKNKKHSTQMPWLTRKEQLEQTGITDAQLYDRTLLEDLVHENIDPFSYEDKASRAILGFLGVKEQRRKDRDMAPTNIQDKPFMGARTDAFNLSMGKPQTRNTFSLSEYKPSKSGEGQWNINRNDMDYFAINKFKDPEVQKELIDVYFNRLNSIDNLSKKYNLNPESLNKLKENKLEFIDDSSAVPKEALESYLNDYGIKPSGNFNNDLAAYKELAQLNKYLQEYDPQTKNVIYTDSKAGVMGNFTLGQGVDESGKKYVSYYDLWDIQTPGGMIPFGKPYHIYDRMYYKNGGLTKYQTAGRVITCPEGYVANENGKCVLKYPYVTIQQFEPDFDLSKATDAEKDIYNRYNTAEKYWLDKGYIPFETKKIRGYLGDYDTFAPNPEDPDPLFNSENVSMNPDSPNSLLAPSFGGIHYFGEYPDESIPKLRLDKNTAFQRQTMYVHPDTIDPKTGVIRGSYDPDQVIGKDKPSYCPGCIREANETDPKEGYYITNDEDSTDLGVGYLRHWYTDPSGKHVTETKGSVLHRDYMSPDEFTNWRSNPSNDRYDILFDPSKTIYKNPGDAYRVLQTERTNKYQSQAEARRKADYEKIQSLKKKNNGGIYLSDYEFKNLGLAKYQKGGTPKEKGWREYKTPTGESLFLDPRFENQRYYVNEKGDAVTPDQNMSLFDVQDSIWESGTSMKPLEVRPRYRYEQRPGALGSFETVRIDDDNGGREIISPNPMETRREQEKFVNSFNPAGMATEGLISIGKGNVGEGLTELALSSPLLPKLLSKTGRQELKQGVSNVVERTSNSDVAKVIDTNTGITFKGKSVPSTMDYLQRRQFAKELQKQGLVGKDFGWDDVNYASRSVDKLNALTKLALERDATRFRGVQGSIPPGGKGFKEYSNTPFDMNSPTWGVVNDDATGYVTGLSEMENMELAGVDLSNPLSIAEYQASHIPMDDYGYRAGLGSQSSFDGLYTGKLPT